MKYKTYRIDEICSLVKGKYATLRTEPGEYPLVVTAPFRRSANTYQLVGPAVCVPIVSSTGHGHAAIDRVHYQEGKFALANLLVALVPKEPDVCNARYLFHLLNAKKDVYFVPLMLGTANVSLKIQDIAGVKIPLPPIDEQKRMVAKIESLMASIEEASRLRMESVKEVERLSYNNLRKTFSNSEFETAVLGEVCRTTSGGTPSRSRPDYFEGNIPWLKSGELNDSLIVDSEERITEEALENSSAKIFPKGTLLIALYGATVGKTGILGIDSSTNQAICALFPQNDVLERDYLHWFLKYKRNDFLEKRFGGAQPNISQSMLRKTNIPFPPLQVQRRIVAYLDSLQEKLNELKKLQDDTGREIGELIPSILDKALEGEL